MSGLVLSVLAAALVGNRIVDSDIDATPLSGEFRLVEGVKRGTLEQVTEDLTWNKALKMTLTEIETNAAGRCSANVCLLAGGQGPKGFSVTPGAKYAFSFEAKGRAPRLIVGWRERDAVGKVRKVRTDMHVIKLTDDWVSYQGTVVASDDAAEGGLVLQLWGNDGHPANWGNKPGDWVMIDKVSVSEMPKVRDIWTDPSAPLAVSRVPTHVDTSVPFRPDELADPQPLVLRAAVNERAVLPIALGNLTDRPENYRVTLTDGFWHPAAQYEHPMVKPFLPGHLTVRHGVAMRDSDACQHGAFLDILEKVSEAGVVQIPAKEAGLIWLQVDCRGLESGVYRGLLQVTRLMGGTGLSKVKHRRAPGAGSRAPFESVEVEDGSTTTYPVEIEILPVVLDEPPAIAMTGFQSVWSEYEASFCNDYDVVMHQICPWFFDAQFATDGSLTNACPRSMLVPHIRFVAEKARRIGTFPRVMVAHSAYEVFKRAHWPKELFACGTPAYWKAFGDWIVYVDRLMRANGFDNDDYVTQLFDEPDPKQVSPEELMRAYVETKRRVPKMKLLQTNGERLYFEQLAPYADYWFFSQHVFGEAWSRRCAERLIASGKTTSIYACGTQMRQSLYRYYRLLPWKVASFGGSIVPLYEIYDRVPAADFRGATQGGVSYNTGAAIVPSIRLENLREGMTDLRCLRQLENLLAAYPSHPRAAEARMLVKKTLEEVPELYPHDFTRAPAFREKAYELIRELSKVVDFTRHHDL